MPHNHPGFQVEATDLLCTGLTKQQQNEVREKEITVQNGVSVGMLATKIRKVPQEKFIAQGQAKFKEPLKARKRFAFFKMSLYGRGKC